MPVKVNNGGRRVSDGPIDELVEGVREYFLLADPDPLYAVLGAWAANHMDGNPVWLMLVGPASCGGTTILRWLQYVPRVHYTGTLSVGGLISGTSEREKSKEATGGLLKQIGKFGHLIMDDFTGLLSLPRDRMTEIIAVMRAAYLGKYERSVGSDGGKQVEWEGKMGFLSKCTQSIDSHSQNLGEMGERLVYWRYHDEWIKSGFSLTRAAIHNVNEQSASEEVRQMVAAYLEDKLGEMPKVRGEFGNRDLVRVIAMAALAARVRGSVRRDQQSSKREIVDMPSSEVPARIGQVLAQLYWGMLAVGVGKKDAWRVVGQVAKDSAPRVRRLIIECVTKGMRSRARGGMGLEWVGVKEMDAMVHGKHLSWGSETVLRRGIEELEVLGVIVRQKSEGGGKKGRPEDGWRLTEWAQGEWEQAGW